MMIPGYRNQIVTRQFSAAEMWIELSWLCAELQRRGHETALISFRFAWDAAMESEGGVIERHVAPGEIPNHVRAMEASGDGELGNDDFCVEVEDIEITFCHESDMHCWFQTTNDLVNALYHHWQESGVEPQALTWCGSNDPTENWKQNMVLWKPLILNLSRF